MTQHRRAESGHRSHYNPQRDVGHGQSAGVSPRRLLRRRHFLGAAGGALALPLMDSMRASAGQAQYPKRIVLVYNPNGTVPDKWFPTAGANSSTFPLNEIHAPLQKYQDKLVIVRGVHSTVGQDPDNNGGPHQRGIGSLFTGQMLQTGEFKDGCGSMAGWADGISLDQRVADRIGFDTPFRSLELGVRCFDNDVQGRISYAGPGRPLPPINDPLLVYERLFFRSEPLDPNDPNSRRQSILDTVKEQFGHLRRHVGRDDREKLEQHLTLVEDLERRLGIGSDQSQACVPPDPPPETDPNHEDDMPSVSRAHVDLIAGAFACDLTRVASLQYSTGFNRIRYPWLDSTKEGHTLSHSGDSNTDAWNELAERATWHASEIAYLVDRLAAIPEGDGSVLDNTLIVWGNEISKGNSHSLDDIPYLLLGSAGGAIKTGQFLDYGGVSSCDLLLTLMAAFDPEAQHFGHPDHNDGMLTGILS